MLVESIGNVLAVLFAAGGVYLFIVSARAVRDARRAEREFRERHPAPGQRKQPTRQP